VDLERLLKLGENVKNAMDKVKDAHKKFDAVVKIIDALKHNQISKALSIAQENFDNVVDFAYNQK